MVLGVLIKREIKAFLKNPAFIFSLILIIVLYSVLFGIMRIGVERAVTETAKINIGVVISENTSLVTELLSLLNETTNGRVHLYNSLREAVEAESIGILIPSGFDELVKFGTVELRSSVRVFSISSTTFQAKLSTLNIIRDLIERSLPIAYSRVYGVEIPRQVKVLVSSSVLYYEREMSSQVFSFLSTLILTLPLLVGIIIGSNAGYAAQLVAFEKVEKAFEMLLSQPIKRSKIVLAKIVGASIASIIFATAYFGGIILPFTLMPPMTVVTNNTTHFQLPQLSITEIGIDPITGLILPTILAILLGLFSSGSLGILLGSLVSDERSAGILISPLTIIYMGLGFAVLFLGLELNYVIAILSGIVVVILPSLYITSLLAGRIVYLVIAVVVAVAMCIVFAILAIVVFNRDIVVLGVRIKTRRARAIFSLKK